METENHTGPKEQPHGPDGVRVPHIVRHGCGMTPSELTNFHSASSTTDDVPAFGGGFLDVLDVRSINFWRLLWYQRYRVLLVPAE